MYRVDLNSDLGESFAASNGVKVQHCKPHGAMYNMAAKDMALAMAIAEVDKDVILMGLAAAKCRRPEDGRGCG